MATGFYVSSHHKRWIVNRAALRQARVEDLQYVNDPEHLDFLGIKHRQRHLRHRIITVSTAS
ncbi:hypothetical protein BKA70DRAFT_1131469 [Coprinopsis sp. MPI-PUGE-AT-0042]|nr:hypothetical protein BKA70DRAFT_1131469 [Coprinopsis sp. MPI-PUGE-AT-0042]